MMTDLYWDEVLLTNNPDSKELEVSFKKIDGDGLLSSGKEPGTPGGATEGGDGSQPPVDDEGDFDPDPGEEPGNGEPVPPVEPPIECEPGNNCDARWDWSDLDIVGQRDSAYYLRDGYESHSDGWFSFWTQQDPADLRSNEPTTKPNGFILLDKDGNEIYNGDADSRMPTMGAQRSNIIMLNSVNPDGGSRKYNTPASPSNQNESNRNINTMQFFRRRWPELPVECAGSYFCAPEWKQVFNSRREGITGSVWYQSAEVPDPTDVGGASKWVGVGGDYSGDEMSHETWNSVFVTRPYSNQNPLTDFYSLTDTQWPTLRVEHSPARWRYVHNGQFGGNAFSQNVYTGGSSIEILPNGRIRYYGSAGNGGFQWFDSRFWLGYDLGYGRDLEAWITCKVEHTIHASRKDTNESGDYGIYANGITRLIEKWDTWFYNGQQITPRFLTSQFTRPQATTGPTFIEHDPSIPIHEYLENPDAQQRPSYATVNRYSNGTTPLEFHADVLAEWLTYPVSTSSFWDANFNSDGSVKPQYVDEYNNDASFQNVYYSSFDCPVLAYVDHTEQGKGFFSSKAFKNMRRAHPRITTPTYCDRIPS